jgi:hypothetical protein
MAKKLDDVASAQRHVGISQNESPGCGYGALTAEMCSKQFFETLAVHGTRSLSTAGCAPSTNAITAAEKRSARSRFRHSTTGVNCGLPLALACLPSQSRTGLEGRAAHGPFGPTKMEQSISFNPNGSSIVTKPRRLLPPLKIGFQKTRRIRGRDLAPQAAVSARRKAVWVVRALRFIAASGNDMSRECCERIAVEGGEDLGVQPYIRQPGGLQGRLRRLVHA